MPKLGKNILPLILLLAAVFRLLIFFLAENLVDIAEIETYSRVNLALEWMRSDTQFPDLNFSPLYFYCIKYMIKLIADPLLAPRWLSFFVGTFLVIPYFYFVDLLFSRKIAIAASLIMALLPLAVRCSVVSLPMVIFVFFIICSFYYFFYYLLKSPRLRFLICSGVCLTVACGLRFEGFLYIPLLPLILFFRKRFKESILLFLISMIIPSVYMWESFSVTGHLLAAAKTASEHSLVHVAEVELWNRILPFFDSLSRTLSLVGWIAALGGIFLSFYTRKNFWLGLIILIYLIVFLYKSAMGTFGPYLIRYFLLIGLLLLPYALFAFDFLLKDRFNFNKALKDKIFSLGIGLFIIFFIGRTFYDLRVIRVPEQTKEMALWLRKHVKVENVILDQVDHPYVVLESRIDYKQIFTPDFLLNRDVNKESFWAIAKKVNPCFLVCRYEPERKGLYSSIVAVENQRQPKVVFRELLGNDLWKVYWMYFVPSE